MASIEFHSQAGQDLFVFAMFAARPGYYVDAGAFDGVHISNTLTLDGLGWDGVCVEAEPANFAALQRNRSCTTIGAALGDRDGVCRFVGGGAFGEISTSESGVEVPCIRFDTLLDRVRAPNVIDYLSLDIEGAELPALSGFPFDRCRIKCMTVEHNRYHAGTVAKDAICALLTRHGYTRVVDDHAHQGNAFEDWYIHTEFRDHFLVAEKWRALEHLLRIRFADIDLRLPLCAELAELAGRAELSSQV